MTNQGEKSQDPIRTLGANATQTQSADYVSPVPQGPVALEVLQQWRLDAEYAKRNGKIEDGVPPNVILQLIADAERAHALQDAHDAARDLLRTAHRPTSDSATAQVNAAALDRLRAALDTTPIPPGERQ